MEADGDRHVRWPLAGQQQRTGTLDPSPGQVTVWRDAELSSERADQVGRRCLQLTGDLDQRHGLVDPVVQHTPQAVSQVGRGVEPRRTARTEVTPQPVHHQR